MSFLEIEGLRKTFRSGWFNQNSVDVLRGASCSLEEGEILVLLGSNGSGKTTLAKIVSTLILPTAGQVRVGGFDLVRQSTKVRDQIALVTNDDRSFFWRMTCYENLRFFCILNNLSEANLKARIENFSQRLHLTSFLAKRFDCCSTGMKRRLSIARALMSRPRLLLLDEPHNSLDAASIQDVKNVVFDQVKNHGMSVLWITHQEQEIADLPHRVVCLEEGVMKAVAA